MQHLSNQYVQEETLCFLPNLEVDKGLFDKIKFPNGKPDLIGVILFSEIFSCYQLSLNLIKDDQENTFLNKSYLDFSEDFSLTKRQVAECITRLESLGFIERHIRMLQVNQKTLPNTVLIKLTQKGRDLLTRGVFDPQINASESSQKHPLHLVSTKESSRSNQDITFKRDIPLERKPYVYINNINNIYKQTNKQAGMFSFEKDLGEEGRGEIKPNPLNPTSLDFLHFEDEKEKWESWAKQEFSWDLKTVFSEIKRFFNYHMARKSLFLDWFSAWKKWCQMSFNRFKKEVSETAPNTSNRIEEGIKAPESNLASTALDGIKDEIREKLTKFDIIGAKAERLIEKFNSVRILKNISYVTAKLDGGKEVLSKSGYLLKAIYEDYAKDFEAHSGESLETIKTPSMIRQEEEELECEITEGEGDASVKKIRTVFLKTFGASIYKAWLRTVKINLEEGHNLILKTSSPFTRDWIENHLKSDIEKSLKSLFSEINRVEFLSC